MNFFKRRNSRSAASSRTQVGDHRRSQPSLQHTNVPLPASPKLVVTAGYGLHPQISHSSLSSDDTKSSSSSRHSNGEVSPNRSAGRNLVGSEGLDTMPRQPPQSQAPHALPSKPPPASSVRPPRTANSTYVDHPDLYTHNALQSFSFGAAPSSLSVASSRPHEPHSRSRGDADSDEYSPGMDTTPRPSVAGSHPQATRSHPTQSPGSGDWHSLYPPTQETPSTRGQPPRTRHERDPDVASYNTRDMSSASTSVSSLSGAASASGTGSKISLHSGTPHTSASDFTDDEQDHRHPIPHSLGVAGDSIVDFSEEEFDDDSDYYYNDIEIGSAMHDPNGQDYYYESTDNFEQYAISGERRGSLAIPGTQANGFAEGRHREDSVITIRRASKSLEELGSFISKPASTNSQGSRNNPLPPAPTSVPESEGDWNNLRRRSMQRDGGAPGSIVDHKSTEHGLEISPLAVSPGVLDELDTSWSGRGMVTTDGMAMFDNLVGKSARRPSAQSRFFGNRRPSTISNNADTFMKNLTTWDEETYQPQQKMWTFHREKETSDLRGPPHDVRGKNVRGSFSSTKVLGDGSAAGDHEQKDKKDKERDTIHWKGMALDSEESWWNDLSGRFKVHRKNNPIVEPGKPPQQRLIIRHFRTAYALNKDTADGPQATIHKHSKAAAFSISRHYRYKDPKRDGNNGASRFNGATDGLQKKSCMVLLAPKRVQEAYTSTTTTRKLESHGLLDDNSGRGSPRDQERTRKEEQEREKLRKEKEKKEKKKKKKTSSDSDQKSKGRSSQNCSQSQESSVGSILKSTFTNASLASTPTHISKQASSSSNITASSSTLAGSSEGIRSPTPGHHPQTKNRHDILEDDVDDYDDEDDEFSTRRRPPTRTPHGEAFGAIPPEELELLVSRQEERTGLFGLRKSTRGGTNNPPNVLDSSYVPPWPSNVLRYNAEYRQTVVDDLNNSFQDVGLLPTASEVRANSSHTRPRKYGQHNSRGKRLTTGANQADVFQDIPPESLYMLVPLWPGTTDIVSLSSHPFEVPHVPLEKRQYLLLYYKVPLTATPNPTPPVATESKKRSRGSRGSPTTSDEKKDEGKSVLLSAFHISARVVAYRDLQGSGVRIPDDGLAVTGSLKMAYDNMPGNIRDRGLQDWIIGYCPSREAGIEFYPEGLVKMGLCNAAGYHESTGDPLFKTTHMGRAVIEMAFYGAMALTSFA